MDMDFSIGGYNIKGWMVAVGIPVLSSIAGGVWWSYDTLQRFYAVEEGIATIIVKGDAVFRIFIGVPSLTEATSIVAEARPLAVDSTVAMPGVDDERRVTVAAPSMASFEVVPRSVPSPLTLNCIFGITVMVTSKLSNSARLPSSPSAI